MLENITMEEAVSHLPEIIERLTPGEEIIITRNNQPVAALHLPPEKITTPRFGNCKGALTIVADDDEHLLDFKDEAFDAYAVSRLW